MKLIYRRGNNLSYETFHAKCDNKLYVNQNNKNLEAISILIGNIIVMDQEYILLSLVFFLLINKKYDYTNSQSNPIYLHANHGPDFNWDLIFNSGEKNMLVCFCATKDMDMVTQKTQ